MAGAAPAGRRRHKASGLTAISLASIARCWRRSSNSPPTSQHGLAKQDASRSWCPHTSSAGGTTHAFACKQQKAGPADGSLKNATGRLALGTGSGGAP